MREKDERSLSHNINANVFSVTFFFATQSKLFHFYFPRKTNRLEEALNIFDTIVNNVNFKGISIILFLNKSDLLAKKVASKETDIRWFYPHYTGDPHSLRDVQMFLLNMFANVRREPKTTLYHHFTTAIDTHNIEVVFNSVKDTILNRNLESLMLQ